MGKRVFIIHCWDGRPNYCWYPWVKKELEKNGFQVNVPAMPETEMPRMEKWVPELRKLVGSPDKDVYLVGHSVGCITILRYLESLKENEKIGGAVLVAGFTDDLDFKEIIGNSQNIVLIEWAEKVKSILLRSTIWIKFEIISNKERKILINSKFT